MKKAVLVSGIQPTGNLHLGNYLGALQNFVKLQNSGKYECYFFIADLHSMTEDYKPKEKQKQILNVALDYLAVGIDPKKSIIFQQSAIPAHSELMWILNTITPFGELRRMTQFKEKAFVNTVPLEIFPQSSIFNDPDDIKIEAKARRTEDGRDSAMENGETSANVGLFDYPVLMASDILLYDANVVPVGNDQLQHLELTRTLARKFNARFPARTGSHGAGGKLFTEPKPLMTDVERLMSLDDPLKKMSKSRPAGCVFVDDAPEVIRKKIMSAVTDSEREVGFDKKNRPALANLLLLYSGVTGKKIEAIVRSYEGKGYAEFKKDLANEVIHSLTKFQANKKALSKDLAGVKSIIEKGNKKASAVSEKKIQEVKKRTGLLL